MRVDWKKILTPFDLKKLLWPGIQFYGKERDIINSVADCPETVVVAGNQLGKDFCGGFIAVSLFIRPQVYFSQSYVRDVERTRSKTNPHPHTVRVVTTSATARHLRVLWGEIMRFIDTSSLPHDRSKLGVLREENGGPLRCNFQDVRKLRDRSHPSAGGHGGVIVAEDLDPVSYMTGMVASGNGEGLAGHHAAYTLALIDEASAVCQEAWSAMQGWSKRRLCIGNPNDCPRTHFFRSAVIGGDLYAEDAQEKVDIPLPDGNRGENHRRQMY